MNLPGAGRASEQEGSKLESSARDRRLLRFFVLLCLLGSSAAILNLAAQKKTEPPAPGKTNNASISLIHHLDLESPTPRPRAGAGNTAVWAEHRAAAKAAQRSGRPAEADLHFAAAAREARGFPPGDKRFVESLIEWAQLALNRGSHEQARRILGEVLAIQETPQDSLAVAEALFLLGKAAGAVNRTAEALHALNRARSIYETHLGAYHPSVGPTLSAIAQVYLVDQRYADAEALFGKALEIALAPKSDVTLPNGTTPRSVRRPDYLTAASLLTDLGALCEKQGREEEAEQHYQKALQAVNQQGEENVQAAARIQAGLGALYVSQKRFDEAERVLKKSLASQEEALGQNHPLVATTLESLAALYQSLNDPARSEAYRQRAKKVRLNAGLTHHLP